MHTHTQVKAPVVNDYYVLSGAISLVGVAFCMPWILLFSFPAVLLSLSVRHCATIIAAPSLFLSHYRRVNIQLKKVILNLQREKDWLL